MKKMTGLILSLVLFLFSFPSVVYAKDKIPIMGNDNLDIKYTEKLNVPSNEEINIKIDTTQPTPILTPLPQIPIEFQKIIDNAKPDEILDISVALDWDSKILVDDFIKQYPELAKEINIKKESAFRFNAKANCTQIEILKNMKEVMRITPPSKARIDLCSNKEDSLLTVSGESYTQNSPMLYDATDFRGWIDYFQLLATPSILKSLDKRIKSGLDLLINMFHS